MEISRRKKILIILLLLYRRKLQFRKLMMDRIMLSYRLRNPIFERHKIAKIKLFYEETVPQLTPRYFRRYFRMFKEGLHSVTEYISNIESIQEFAEKCRIPVPKQVAITLAYLGSKSTTISVAHLFGISEERLLTISETVMDALISNIQDIIKWPKKEEYQYIANKFNNIGKHFFPNVVGAIDGCHLEIEITEEKRNEDSYVNFHNWPSLVLQGTCTYDLSFIYVQAGWPGRANDAGIFNKCSLKERLDSLMHIQTRDLVNSYHIVGDSAFPIQKSLMVPYKGILGDVIDPVRSNFNKCLASKRQNIERAFSLLLRRFPRLYKLNMKTIRKKIKVILAACILHNLCIREKDNIDYFLRRAAQDRRNRPRLLNNYNFDEIQSKQDGFRKRNLICARLYNLGDSESNSDDSN